LEKNRIKQIDRLAGNSHLLSELTTIYRGIGLMLLGSKARPVILVDWSDLTPERNFAVLRATLPVGGRGLPLYEESHDGKDYANARVQKAFLETLNNLLPAGIKPIIVTDAGFQTPWFKAVENLGWDWVGRLRKDMNLRRHDGDRWITAKTLHVLQTTEPMALGTFELTKQIPIECQLYGIKKRPKGRKHTNRRGERAMSTQSRKQAKREKEPWIIASSFSASAGEVIGYYRRRMEIEGSFRDTKSKRFGLSMEFANSRSKQRFAVLLVIGALAAFVAWIVGKIAEGRDLQRDFQANTERSRKVLSTFSVGLIAYRTGLSFTVAELWAAMRSFAGGEGPLGA
jgi:hypothetical protein